MTTPKLKPCPAGHPAEMIREGQSAKIWCPICGWRIGWMNNHEQLVERWNARPTEDALRARAEEAESKLAEAQRQAAAMREAINAMLGFSVDGVPRYYPTHILADAYSSIQPDAGREYVPKADLERAQQQAAAMREAIQSFLAFYNAKPDTAEASQDALCMAINALHEALQADSGCEYVQREALYRWQFMAREALRMLSEPMCDPQGAKTLLSNVVSQIEPKDGYVPRSELEAAEKRVEELRELLRTHCWQVYEDGTYCTACGGKTPKHADRCEIQTALGKEVKP